MEPNGIELTESEIKEFKNSRVWSWIQAELIIWIEAIRDKLETTAEHGELRRLQGNAEAAKHVLGIVENMEEDYARRFGTRSNN